MASRPQMLLDDIVFPEGPRWHEGKLWFSDILGKQVRTADLDGNSEVLLAADWRPSGIGFLPDGTPVVTSMLDSKVYRLSPEGPRLHADLSGLPSKGLNDMVVDGQGRAYVDSRGSTGDPSEPDGEVALAMPDGTSRVLLRGLKVPNGMVIAPDGKTLILAECFANRLLAYDIQEDGSLSGQRVFADTGEHSPDGICLDAEGAVWAGSPPSKCFIRVRDGGEIADRIDLPDRTGIACMLGGDDRRTLFLLTNQTDMQGIMKGFSGEVDAREVCRGFIETVRVDVPGAGLP